MPPSFTDWQRKVRQRLPSRAKPATDNPTTEPDGEALILDEHSNKAPSGHVYPTVVASGHASLHLGDVHYHASRPPPSTKEQLKTTLHFPEMFQRFENIQDPHQDTFTWILKPPQEEKQRRSSFENWLHQPGGLYWISGKPGSGKSVLTKHLTRCAQQMQVEEEDHSLIVLSFWFWEASHIPLERNLIGCLRSLLWQLLNHPRYGDAICEAIGADSTFEWTSTRLQVALNNSLTRLARLNVHILVFLDGLDECGQSGGDVLRFATNIVKQYHHLKLCVSSRSEPLFQVTLSPYPHLRMQDLNAPDVNAIIEQNLLWAPEFGLVAGKDYQGQFLQREIADMAQGVLLWVHLVTKNLLQGIVDGDTVQELETRLRKMPSELDGENGLYAFMLKRNAANSESYLADAAFYCQLAIHRKMSIIEFSLASNDNLRANYIHLVDGWERLHFELDCDRMARAVSARTAGLLEVSRYTAKLCWRAARTRCAVLTDTFNNYGESSVKFIHRTARTYVLETTAGNRILAASTRSLDDIKRICFETWLVSSIVLGSLESAAPVGLPHLESGWLGCEHCNESRSETSLLGMKDVIAKLEQKSLLWTMPCRSSRWKPEQDYVPFPKLNEHTISFDLLFASLGIWKFAKSELNTSVPDPSHMLHLFWSVVEGLRQDMTYRDFCVDFSKRGLQFCDEILDHFPSPNSELANADGERVPAFYPIMLQYREMLAIPKRERMVRGPIQSIDLWVKQISAETWTRRCNPTMAQCCQQFFGCRWYGTMSILGAFSFVDMAPLLQFTTGEEDADLRTPKPDKVDAACILWNWPRHAWKPRMYKTSRSEGIAMLQDLVRYNRKTPNCVARCDIGIIQVEDQLPNWVKLAPPQRTELNSLVEVFRVLGKSTEAIDRFAAAEDDRIRIAYGGVIYRRWRSWMYGVDEPSIQQQYPSRPFRLLYDLVPEDQNVNNPRLPPGTFRFSRVPAKETEYAPYESLLLGGH